MRWRERKLLRPPKYDNAAAIFDLVLKGHHYKEIAKQLGMSAPSTKARIRSMGVMSLYKTQQHIKLVNRCIARRTRYPYLRTAIDMLRKNEVKVYIDPSKHKRLCAEGLTIKPHMLTKRWKNNYRSMPITVGLLHIFMTETGKVLFCPPFVPRRNRHNVFFSDRDFALSRCPTRKFLIDFRKSLERQGALKERTYHEIGEGYYADIENNSEDTHSNRPGAHGASEDGQGSVAAGRLDAGRPNSPKCQTDEATLASSAVPLRANVPGMSTGSYME